MTSALVISSIISLVTAGLTLGDFRRQHSCAPYGLCGCNNSHDVRLPLRDAMSRYEFDI